MQKTVKQVMKECNVEEVFPHSINGKCIKCVMTGKETGIADKTNFKCCNWCGWVATEGASYFKIQSSRDRAKFFKMIKGARR